MDGKDGLRIVRGRWGIPLRTERDNSPKGHKKEREVENRLV